MAWGSIWWESLRWRRLKRPPRSRSGSPGDIPETWSTCRAERKSGATLGSRLPELRTRSLSDSIMADARPTGPVARYARGDDYHDVITNRLNELRDWLESEVGRPIRGKAYVDTGPILERDLARRGGLGWFGQNTNRVDPGLGSV